MAALKETPGKPAAAPPAPKPAPPRVSPPVAKVPPVVQKRASEKPAAATPSSPPVPASPPTNPPMSGAMGRERLVIVFVDLARFQIASRRVKDADLVPILEEYYDAMVSTLKPAGGRIVKFMGDGALVVFEVGDASDAAQAVLDLKRIVDEKLAARHFNAVLVARVHAGEVMAGPFGPKGEKRYDVIGQNVNRTAAMKLGELVSLTGDAYDALDGDTKKLFKARGDYYVPV
jgi:class 3 adenylate cyclase